MTLTVEEFCQFNMKSRIQLLNKDGRLIKVRNVSDKYIVKLYKIYKFFVEVIEMLKNKKTIKVEPVLNLNIIHLYSETA